MNRNDSKLKIDFAAEARTWAEAHSDMCFALALRELHEAINAMQPPESVKLFWWDLYDIRPDDVEVYERLLNEEIEDCMRREKQLMDAQKTIAQMDDGDAEELSLSFDPSVMAQAEYTLENTKQDRRLAQKKVKQARLYCAYSIRRSDQYLNALDEVVVRRLFGDNGKPDRFEALSTEEALRYGDTADTQRRRWELRKHHLPELAPDWMNRVTRTQKKELADMYDSISWQTIQRDLSYLRREFGE